MPARYVNDAQTPCTQKHVGVGVIALVVRAAMGEEGELRVEVRMCSGGEEAEDAAHGK
jgi:hypothetical protein